MFRECLHPVTWLEERVYILLQYHEFYSPGEIDLIELCRTYRVEVWFEEGRSRAFPHPTKQGWHVIQVDIRLWHYVQREKIAHEFGHLVLHEGIQPDSNKLMVSWQEAQISHFVDHLLLPFYMFDKIDFKQISRYEAPRYISQLFQVSEEMASRRFDRFLNRIYIKNGHAI